MVVASGWIDRLLGGFLIVGIIFSIWKYNQPLPEIDLPKPDVAATPAVMPEPIEPFSPDDMERFQKLKLMHVTGDYNGALHLAHEYLQGTLVEPAFRDWLTRQLGPLMAAAGWLKIRTGECDEALKIFYKAVRIGPTPEAKKGLGVCLHASKQWPEAASWLAAFLFDEPKDLDARLIYADALESLGRFDEALKTMEGAAEISGLTQAQKDAIQLKLQAMKVKAREGVSQKSEYSRRFFVSFREGEHDVLLPKVFEILESALDEFSEVLGILPKDTLTEVVLYRQEAFRDVVPGGPEWSEGVFDGRIRVPLSREMVRDPSGLLTTVLRHELSHALLAQAANGRTIPAWFDEGVAQYLSCRGRPCSEIRFPATPGRFSDVGFLGEPFVTLSAIDAGRAYFHSRYLIAFVSREKTEEKFRSWGSDLSGQGEISSDVLSRLLGYNSFADLVSQASGLYAARTAL